MHVKTKSGFEWDVNEKNMKDWDFVDALAKCVSDDELKILTGARSLMSIMLGEDGIKALQDHVRDDEGIADAEAMFREVTEMMALTRAEIKK